MKPLSRPVLKEPGHGDRSVALVDVLRRVPELRHRYGITRIADTTDLDRIGIPTMSAFVPRSPDILGVYSGKGRTRDEALASTVMEAVERQISVAYSPPTRTLFPHELAPQLNLHELGYEGPADRPLRCVEGVDLLSAEPLSVPLGLANPFADSANFPEWTTNGLAAGLSLAEALHHALFEVVERHRWSTAEIEASAWPRFLRAAYHGLNRLPQAESDQSDEPAASEVALPTGDPNVDGLVTSIRDAGISLRLFALTDDEWPVAMFANLYEAGASPPMVHSGMGCSWSPRRAAVAAITEAVSSRAIVIQGAREDLSRARGLPLGRWFFDVPAPMLHYADIPDRADDDFCVDIRRLLEVIRRFGVRCVAMVDLSPPDGSVHVVRVAVPGLERYAVDGSITGRTKRLLMMPTV